LAALCCVETEFGVNFRSVDDFKQARHTMAKAPAQKPVIDGTCLKIGGSTMKALLSIPIAAALTCGTLSAGATESLKQQLVGTWSVISFVNENERTGTRVEIFGSTPGGYFMFDAAGHFSINLMRVGRPKFGNRDFPTATESKAALEGIIVMFGDYKVNESEHSISLHIIGGSFPTWDNTNQKRFIAITDDELTYKNPTPASGGGTAVVTLKRATSAAE
jgi:hypothetical protein